MTKRWGCPFCDQRCSRNWNMKVYIKRKHKGLAQQPIDLFLNEEQIRLQPGDFSATNYNNMYGQKQQRGQQQENKEKTIPFSPEFTEKVFLQPLRQLREFKQLLDDIFPNQYYYYQIPVRMREYYQSTINAVNNNNNNNNSWSGLKGIVDSKLEPKGKKLHDHLRLIEAEMIDGIIHNNKKKINSVEIEKRLLTYSSCSNKVKRDMYNRADN